MKIKKIYISAFGKLKDYTLDLSDGLNVIYGENEQGKSTVMAFVKMMFYGSGRGSSQVSKNIRLKYTPWSGERAAGRIFFEHSGTNYCLEREFLKSDNTDKVKLINTDTGESKAVGSSIGSEFFNLSSAAFERTVFIGQTGTIAKDEEANGEINSKLSNIVLTGDEDISFQTVFTRLNDAKLKLMSKSGKAGKYDKGKIALEELKLKLRQAEEKEQRKTELNGSIKAIKGEMSVLSEKYLEVKKTVDSEKDIKNRQKLEEYLSLKDELDRLNSEIKLTNGALPDENYLRKIEFCLSKAETALQRLKDYEAETDRLKKNIELADNTDKEEIANQQSALEDRLNIEKEELRKLENSLEGLEQQLNEKNAEKQGRAKKRKPFSPILLCLGALLVLAGIFVGIILNSVFISGITAVIGVILLVLSFVLRPADTKTIQDLDIKILNIQSLIAEKKSNGADLKRKILDTTESLNTLLAAVNADKAVIAERKAELEARLARFSEEKEKFKGIEQELFKITEIYKPAVSIQDVKALLPELSAAAEKQKQLKLKLKYLSDDLDCISYETAREKLNSMDAITLPSDTDFEEKRKELEAINEKITALKEEFSAITAELKTAFKNFAAPDEIKKEMDSISETLKGQKYFCDIADIAANVLESSFIEIRRSYGSALEKKALEIFSRLTKGRYANVNVSKSLDITVEEADSFGTREVDYLSSGTVDQAYLSLRLALSELITDEEKLPVFLDDVFCQYDDKRAETAIEFLKEYSSLNQSILFTCHNSVCDIAEKLSLPSKKL